MSSAHARTHVHTHVTTLWRVFHPCFMGGSYRDVWGENRGQALQEGKGSHTAEHTMLSLLQAVHAKQWPRLPRLAGRPPQAPLLLIRESGGSNGACTSGLAQLCPAHHMASAHLNLPPLRSPLPFMPSSLSQ